MKTCLLHSHKMGELQVFASHNGEVAKLGLCVANSNVVFCRTFNSRQACIDRLLLLMDDGGYGLTEETLLGHNFVKSEKDPRI